VGRSHAELTVSDNGACYIVDLDSANGTFLKEAGKWKRIKQAALDLGSEIRLGDYRTTPALLLSMRSVRASPRQQTPPQIQPPKTEPRAHGAKPRRNPLTGEVE
jgi:predicted component of type VI protein secretion system